MTTVRQDTKPGAQQPAGVPGSDLPLIDSPAAAAEALRDYFLANADRGDNAANDELVAELVRRIRTHQTADLDVCSAADSHSPAAAAERELPRRRYSGAALENVAGIIQPHHLGVDSDGEAESFPARLVAQLDGVPA